MEVFVLVLNKTEFLSDILQDMKDGGFSGATVMDCTAMLRELDLGNVDAPMLGLLRHYHAPDRSKCNLVITLIQESQRQTLCDIINRRTGGMEQVEAGVMFSIPMASCYGISHR